MVTLNDQWHCDWPNLHLEENVSTTTISAA